MVSHLSLADPTILSLSLVRASLSSYWLIGQIEPSHWPRRIIAWTMHNLDCASSTLTL